MNSTGIHGFLQPPMLDLRDFTWISRILQILSKNPQNLPRPQLHVKREVGDVRSGREVGDGANSVDFCSEFEESAKST